MTDRQRFYQPEAVEGWSEDARKAVVVQLGKEIRQLEDQIKILAKRRMSLMTFDELHSEDRRSNW